MKNFLNIFKKGIQDEGSSMDILYQTQGLKTQEETWGKSEFLNAFNTCLYLNSAIEKRATKVSEIEFVLKQGDKEIESSPILNLLSKPNEYHTGKQFFNLYQKYKDLTGEVYILLVKKNAFMEKSEITKMYLLNPLYVERIYNKETGELIAYNYKNGAETKTYTPDEIIFDFVPDPNNPIKGISLIRSGAKIISIGNQIDDYQVSLLRNGGKIDGVLSFKGENITKAKLDDLKDNYKKNYSEAIKSGMPLFLGGEATYNRVALNPEELSYLQTKNMTLNDICIMTNVPKSLLGSTDDVKYDNADASLRIFLRETIKPLMEAIVEKLNEKLELIPAEYTLDFINPTPDDIDMIMKTNESGIKNSYLSINEARANLNLDPVENGDEILVPFNLSPLSMGFDEPVADVPPAKEPEPAKSIETKTFHPLRNKENRKRYYAKFIKQSDKNESKFRRALRSYLNGQAKRLISKISPSLTNGYITKDLYNDFDAPVEIRIGIKELQPLLYDMLLKAGNESMELVGVDKPFQFRSEIESWLNAKSEVFLKQINDTTFKKLTKEFSESLSSNESREELVKRIKNTYSDISKGRANTIARTEVQGAVQKGSFEGYGQAGMPIKIWVAVLDSETRDDHASLDGEERPLNTPFSNGLMYPGDPGGDASDICNCRCTI